MGIFTEHFMNTVRAYRDVVHEPEDLVQDPGHAMDRRKRKMMLDSRHFNIHSEILKGLSADQMDSLMAAVFKGEEYRKYEETIASAIKRIMPDASQEAKDRFRREHPEAYAQDLGLALFSAEAQDGDLERLLTAMEDQLTPEELQSITDRIDRMPVKGELTEEEKRSDPLGEQIEAMKAKIPADHPQRQQLISALDQAHGYLIVQSPEYKKFSEEFAVPEQKVCSGYMEKEGERAFREVDGGRYHDFMDRIPTFPRSATMFAEEEIALQDELLSRSSIQLTPAFRDSVSRIARRMNETFDIARDAVLPAEEGNPKIYGFRNLTADSGVKRQGPNEHSPRTDLEDAIKSGDLEAFLPAFARYSQSRQDMIDFFGEVRENFNRDHIYPTNVDVCRTDGIPFEFYEDRKTQSEVNAVYQIYAYAHNKHIDIDELLSDPLHVTYDTVQREIAQGRPSAQVTGTSAGRDLASIRRYVMDRTSSSNTVRSQMGMSRTLETLAICEPDKKKRAELLMNMHAMDRVFEIRGRQAQAEEEFFEMNFNEPGASDNFAYMLQMMAVAPASDVDFKAFTGMDDRGKAIQAPSVEDYIGDPLRSFDYTTIAAHGQQVISDFRDEASKNGISEGAAKALENEMQIQTREAQVKLLLARQFDREKPGFEALEQEILNLGKNSPEFDQLDPEVQEQLTQIGKVYRAAKASMEKDAQKLSERVVSKDGKLNEQLTELAAKRQKADNEARLGNNVDKNQAESYRLQAEIMQTAGHRLEELQEDFKKGRITESYFRQRAEQIYSFMEKGKMEQKLPSFFENERERSSFLSSRAYKRHGLHAEQKEPDQAVISRTMNPLPAMAGKKLMQARSAKSEKEKILFGAETITALERAVDQLETKKGRFGGSDSKEYTALRDASRELLADINYMYGPGANLTGEPRKEAISRIQEKMFEVQELAKTYSAAKDKGGKKHTFTLDAGATRYLAAKDLQSIVEQTDRKLIDEMKKSTAELSLGNPESRKTFLGIDQKTLIGMETNPSIIDSLPADQKPTAERLKAVRKAATSGELARGGFGGVTTLSTLTFMHDHPEVNFMDALDPTKYVDEKKAAAEKVISAAEKAMGLKGEPAQMEDYAKIVADGMRVMNQMDVRKNLLQYLGVTDPDSVTPDQAKEIFSKPENRDKVVAFMAAQSKFIVQGRQIIQEPGIAARTCKYEMIDFSKTGKEAAADLLEQGTYKPEDIPKAVAWIDAMRKELTPEEAQAFYHTKENGAAFSVADNLRKYITGENRTMKPEEAAGDNLRFQALIDQVAVNGTLSSSEILYATESCRRMDPVQMGIPADTPCDRIMRSGLTQKQISGLRDLMPTAIAAEGIVQETRRTSVMQKLAQARALRAQKKREMLMQEVAKPSEVVKRGRRMSVGELMGKKKEEKKEEKKEDKKEATARRTRRKSVNLDLDAPAAAPGKTPS